MLLLPMLRFVLNLCTCRPRLKLDLRCRAWNRELSINAINEPTFREDFSIPLSFPGTHPSRCLSRNDFQIGATFERCTWNVNVYSQKNFHRNVDLQTLVGLARCIKHDVAVPHAVPLCTLPTLRFVLNFCT